jgi:hypothetical protein
MITRTIDYYIKGLPFDVRQRIWELLDDINPERVRKLLEKTDGYPAFHSIGYSEESIAKIIQQSSERFRALNEYLEENNRYPFFSDPTDTYNSSLEYNDLIKKKSTEKLFEEFGCLWEEYVPKEYDHS